MGAAEGGRVVVVRGRGVWRKRWSMWLRIMSKKLHKAFSQITYQLHAWHYPWSISSVLDQVPIVLRCKYTCAHPHTCIHNYSSPLAANTWANISLSLFLPLCIYLPQLIYIVFGGKSNDRNKTCQVSYQYGDLPSLAAVPPLQQTLASQPVISKPVFGEASLSEQWENIQCISIGRLWFLFVLHLLCLAIVHRNDSRVHCINSQTTWFLLDFVEIQSINVKHVSHFSFCLWLSPLLHSY